MKAGGLRDHTKGADRPVGSCECGQGAATLFKFAARTLNRLMQCSGGWREPAVFAERQLGEAMDLFRRFRAAWDDADVTINRLW